MVTAVTVRTLSPSRDCTSPSRDCQGAEGEAVGQAILPGVPTGEGFQPPLSDQRNPHSPSRDCQGAESFIAQRRPQDCPSSRSLS